MPNQQNDQTQNRQADEQNATASGGYQTPVDEEKRHTGMDIENNADPAAVPESGNSDQLTEGAGNQGTEKR